MPQTDIIILKTLLESQPEFVSGNQLANELGISRVGVWARLEKLRELDFGFEAVRHRGYRLLQEPPVLNERLLRAYLSLAHCEARLHYLAETDSTNSHAERLLAGGEPTPFVVLAGRQTAGRGRFGRVWHSPAEGNLYASFGFRPQLPPDRMQRVTLWLGLKICDLLNRVHELPVRVKWPNDLLLEGRKVAGILTEARVDSDQIRELVVGLGLNVSASFRHWPKEVAAVATTLAQHRPQPIRINHLAATLLPAVLAGYEEYLRGIEPAAFQALWDKYDCLRGRVITTVQGGQTLTGVAQGIDADGCLLLRRDDGGLSALHSGEVSLSGSVPKP